MYRVSLCAGSLNHHVATYNKLSLQPDAQTTNPSVSLSVSLPVSLSTRWTGGSVIQRSEARDQPTSEMMVVQPGAAAGEQVEDPGCEATT